VSGVAARLRPAEASDFAAIHAIYRHHVLNGLGSFEEHPPELAEMQRRHGDVVAHGLPYLVALAGESSAGSAGGGKLLGYAYAAPFRARSAYRFTVEDSVYIAPDAVGHGVGRALLTEVIERCTALGKRQMIAVIGDSGNAGSIALHRALGFSPPMTLHGAGFKFGRWVDIVLMQRALGPGNDIPPPPGA
jgi:phosphinothricin acetyltransferase